jgi:hypothetical protein
MDWGKGGNRKVVTPFLGCTIQQWKSPSGYGNVYKFGNFLNEDSLNYIKVFFLSFF